MSSKLFTDEDWRELNYATAQLTTIRAMAEGKLNYLIRKLTAWRYSA